jgi:branched-chain amino acid transport system substrate-binding protein
MQFLGTNTWHSPELIARSQTYAEGAIFADSFFADSASPVVKKFVARYKATFGENPGSIEALAFDAASLLERALLVAGSKSREDLKDNLKSIVNFPGVTGRISWKDGQFVRAMEFLTVKNGQIAEVQ